MPDFSSYLESVGRHYEPWCRLYTPIDAVGQADRMEWFNFGFIVQTIVPQKDDPRETGDRAETVERFTVLEGLRKCAGEQVLLVGRPGSGKSTALTQLLLQEAQGQGDCIPVLVELRYWNEDGVMGLIRSFLVKFGMSAAEVDRTTLEGLLRSKKLLLLMDGLNELPSEAGRQDVRRFRREFSGVAIVFTTRDLSVGGDFGIEKKLEMQPLTETQMKQFVMAYLPEQSEAMLRQLGGRLREFGSTPLLLWMLCGLFRQTGEIPANLGSVFRAFTTGYERSLKADVVLEGDRRWWAGLLQALAARMMIGDGSVEFRVAIDRAEMEAIFTEFLRNRESLAAGAARKGLEDLLRHHLIQTNGVQVEFRHQLIQEYYAAEWLLVRVGGLDDATLQQEFLNYLKWTEPVALMLALVEDEGLAVRVVELALDVDLMLGARLAGEVRSGFQKKTVGLVNSLDIPDWLKIEMLGQTRSIYAIDELKRMEDFDFGFPVRNALDRIKCPMNSYSRPRSISISRKIFLEDAEFRDKYLPMISSSSDGIQILTEIAEEKFQEFKHLFLETADQQSYNSHQKLEIRIISLEAFPCQCVSHLFPEIRQLILDEYGKVILSSFINIQAKCQFYNYEIEQQAEPRKADRHSLEGDRGDPSLPATITYNVKELTLVSEQQPIFNQYNPTIGVNYAAENSNPRIIQNIQAESQDTALLAIVQIIQALEKKYTFVQDPQQAIDIIDAEFKSLEASRSPQWQNLLNVKRLYNGGKNAAVKVSEHFAQENVWGKGAVAFLEGISEDVK